MRSREAGKQRSCAYLPSFRLEEGTTRSRVRGSRMIPAAVLWGLKDGRDIVIVLMHKLKIK